MNDKIERQQNCANKGGTKFVNKYCVLHVEVIEALVAVLVEQNSSSLVNFDSKLKIVAALNQKSCAQLFYNAYSLYAYADRRVQREKAAMQRNAARGGVARRKKSARASRVPCARARDEFELLIEPSSNKTYG